MSALKKKFIYIVEDDPDIRSLLTELLISEGYEARSAESGKAALTRLNSVSALPDLIILDLRLDREDSLQIRQKQLLSPGIAHIPVVVMSADENIEEKVVAFQASGFIRKPLDIPSLIKTVESAVL